MSDTDIVERLLQTAHDFELHDPERGVTFRGRCDVEAIRIAAERLRSGRAAIVDAAQRYLDAQLLIDQRIFEPPDAWAPFADAEDALRDAIRAACPHDYEAHDDKGWTCKLCGHET